MENANKDKTEGEVLAKNLGVSHEYGKDMDEVIKYMEKHRMPELFNEILTRILDERPHDAKFHIIEYLKAVKKVDSRDPHSQKVYHFVD